MNNKMKPYSDLVKPANIFAYLKSPDLKSSLVHDCFKDAMNKVNWNETLDPVDLQMNFSVDEAKLFLCTCGQYIKRYHYICSFPDESIGEYLNLIPTLCSNIEEIIVSGLEIAPGNIHGQLIRVSCNLTTLRLKKCTMGNATSSLFSGLTKLQCLDLEGSKLSGKGFHALHNLVDLSLKNCRNFRCKYIIDICKNNQLKALNLLGFKQLTPFCLKTLVDSQSSLETLTVGQKYWSKNFETICNLKSLREIAMLKCHEDIIAKYLKVLLSHRKDAMECIEMHTSDLYSEMEDNFLENEIVDSIGQFENLRALSFRNCSILGNQHLVRIVKSCRRLEMLDLRGSSFTNVGILGCIEHLPLLRFLDISHCVLKANLYFRMIGIRQELNFDGPLIVYIKPKMEMAALLNSVEYEAYKDYITLTFDEMRITDEISILDCLEHHNSLHRLKIEPSNCENFLDMGKPSLLQLDDNCLYQIMPHLRIIDKLTLTLVNSRFVEIIKHLLFTDLVDFSELLENFTIGEARKILSRCGHMIKRLCIAASPYHLDTEYYDLIAEFCPNLEELDCIYVEHTEKLVDIIQSSSGSLRKIEIRYCNCDDSVSMAISKVANLRELCFKIAHISGAHLSKLTKLIRLELTGCRQLLSRHFNKICRANLLEILDIKDCEKLDFSSFETLAETQCNLQRLQIGGSYLAVNLSAVAELNSLKHLNILQSAAPQCIGLLNHLAPKRARQIQSLDIHLDDVNVNGSILSTVRSQILEFRNLVYFRTVQNNIVDDAFMKRIVQVCPQLELIDVYQQYNLGDDGILFAVKNLRNLRNFDIRGCGYSNLYSLYHKLLKVKRQICNGIPLIVHISHSTKTYGLQKTKEYVMNTQYVSFTQEWLCEIDLIKYFGDRAQKHRNKKLQPTVENFANDCSVPDILTLPDKCLTRIATYLETMDQLKFVSVHPRFLNACQDSLSNVLYDINALSENFTLAEARKLFTDCNSHIRKIRFEGCVENSDIEYLKLLQPLSAHFTEIHIEQIDSSDHDSQVFEDLVSSPDQMIRKIAIRSYDDCDRILTKIKNKNCVEVIDISGCPYFAASISQFSNLKELYAARCDVSEIGHFIDMLRNCRLNILDIRDLTLLTNEAINVMIESQNECLKRLLLTCPNDAENCVDVAKLSRLRHVLIQFNENFAENINSVEVLLDKLIKYHSNDLLSLEIISAAYRVTDFSWYRAVEKRRYKFQKLQKFETITPEPYNKPYRYD